MHDGLNSWISLHNHGIIHYVSQMYPALIDVFGIFRRLIMIYSGVSDEYIQPTNRNHSDSKEQKVKNSEEFCIIRL